MGFLLTVKSIILVNMITLLVLLFITCSLDLSLQPLLQLMPKSYLASCRVNLLITAPHLTLHRSSHFVSQSLRNPFGTHWGISQGGYPRPMGNGNKFWDSSEGLWDWVPITQGIGHLSRHMLCSSVSLSVHHSCIWRLYYLINYTQAAVSGSALGEPRLRQSSLFFLWCKMLSFLFFIFFRKWLKFVCPSGCTALPISLDWAICLKRQMMENKVDLNLL